jgi:nicotinamidase-related amidase
MSTFTERSTRALLVIDVQVGVVKDAYRRDKVIQNIRSLVDAARADAAPVGWIQHNEPDMPIDGDEWQLGPELPPQRRVGALVICGAQTNTCDLTKTARAFA